MAKNDVMKLVEMITIMELIIVAAAASAVDKNGSGYNEQDFSPKCLMLCGLQCLNAGMQAPFCFATCLLQCHDPPVVSDAIKNCTSTCAESVCSKYVGSDMNMLEGCVVNNCARKCIAGT